MFYMFGSENGDAQIQYQDSMGNWITIGTTPQQGNLVIEEMRRAQSLYPDRRIRATDMDGRMIDKL